VSVRHYENFPVASLLLPAALREPVGAIYRFARGATTSPMKATTLRRHASRN